MKISSKFTVAVHTLLCIYRLKKEYKVTSDFIAGSTGVNPVIIGGRSFRSRRRVL
ncbi:MAG: hypothetical protein L6V90_10875 [Treponema succinifaciens]|nr:MAG: hypothetical protein L6V90_10875 [Treponema succinifaciens]